MPRSGVHVKPRVYPSFPVAAKTGTSNTNGATWVVGYTTGLATASFFGDTLDGQKRPGQNITVNGKFYQSIDGYMLAGPQWANYMLGVAGLYPAGAFRAPPESMAKKSDPRIRIDESLAAATLSGTERDRAALSEAGRDWAGLGGAEQLVARRIFRPRRERGKGPTIMKM